MLQEEKESENEEEGEQASDTSAATKAALTLALTTIEANSAPDFSKAQLLNDAGTPRLAPNCDLFI